jgi:hypothetical protein
MTEERKNSATQTVHSGSLTKRMLQGAGIALVVISAFMLSAGEGDPAWPKLWMIKPLLVVPIAGAMGGMLYYKLDGLRNKGGWASIIATVLSLTGFLFALWLGTVLGLNGTWWD